MKAIIAGLALFLSLGTAVAAPLECTARPAAGSSPDTHSKANSFAPSGRPHKRAYGAPIPKPIVTRHAKPRRKSVTAPPP